MKEIVALEIMNCPGLRMQIKKIQLHTIYILSFCLLMLLASSCNPTVYLSEGESLLADNKLIIQNKKNVNAPGILKDELELNYIQIPNREFLFIPREWYHYRLEGYEGGNSLLKVVKNQIAEEPSIHDEEKMNDTAKKLQNYLRNRKGYYYAKVETKTKIKEKEAFVTYFVDPGKQFSVGEIVYNCTDPNLKYYVDSLAQHTLIPAGSPITESKFSEEKIRIARELQNLGFATFSSAYVKFLGDTSDFKMDVDVNILSLPNKVSHKKYSVGNIKVYTDFQAGVDTFVNSKSMINNIDFYSQADSFFVKPKTINKRIVIEEGETYSKDRELRTSRRLSSLNSYRFVRLNPSIDSIIDTLINYNFLLTPIKDRYVRESNIDAYFIGIAVDSNFLGLGGGASLTKRNNRNRAESYSIGASGFVEFNLNTLSSVGSSINLGYQFPELHDATRLLWFSEKAQILPLSLYNLLNDYTTTNVNLSASYNFTNTIYTLVSVSGTYGFNYKPNINWQVNFSQAGINFLYTDPLQVFQERLDSNPYLKRAFSTRLLTGFIIRDLSLIYNTTNTASGFNWGGYWNVETSGAEVFALNKIYNGLTSNTTDWELFSKFVKFDLDQHFSQKITEKTSIAGKFRAGIALPFGGQESVVPFVRQFAAGGQNSIRGWVLRDLGPGAYDFYTDGLFDPNAVPFPFQTGDFLLESSLELRFPVYGFLKGAFFVDAGNVWTLNDQDRENSQLSKDFYKQIAIASGIGIRLDFSLFLIRFDLGYKVRNPFPYKETGRNYNSDLFTIKSLLSPNPTLGIGLPF